MKRAHNAAWRHRALWLSTALALDGTLIVIGGGYAFGGGSYGYVTPGLRVIKLLPGGLYTHGAIMFGLGLILLAGLGGFTQHGGGIPWLTVRWALIGTVFYCTWASLAFLGSWYLNGHYSNGLWWYLLLAALAGPLVAFPPFPSPPGGGRA